MTKSKHILTEVLTIHGEYFNYCQCQAETLEFLNEEKRSEMCNATSSTIRAPTQKHIKHTIPAASLLPSNPKECFFCCFKGGNY